MRSRGARLPSVFWSLEQRTCRCLFILERVIDGGGGERADGVLEDICLRPPTGHAISVLYAQKVLAHRTRDWGEQSARGSRHIALFENLSLFLTVEIDQEMCF